MSIVKADGRSFHVTLIGDDLDRLSRFVQCGSGAASVSLGYGERRAVVRDALEMMARASIDIDDLDRISSGQIPLGRNLVSERALAPRALATFKTVYNHAPNFKNAEENLFWNTLMYRMRFPRDLVKEKKGILAFKALFHRVPADPFQWSVVRALGYVKS